MWKSTGTIRRDVVGNVWYRLIEKGDAVEYTCDNCSSRIRGILYCNYNAHKICRVCAAKRGWEW